MAGACTGDEEEPVDDEARQRLLAASEATEAAGTARMEQRMSLRLPERLPAGDPAPNLPAGSLEIVTSGLIDLRNRGARLSVSTEGTGMAGADALAGDSRLIVIGDTMFISSPFYQELAPNLEPWLRIGFDELRERGLSQVGQQDPLAFVGATRGLTGEVEEIGAERVRDVEATRYRASVDIDRLEAEVPESSRAAIRASFGHLGIDRFPIDVWLDTEGRLVRLTSEIDLRGAAAGGRMELGLELFDFGVAFDLARPPEESVAEFGEVFGALQD